MIEYKAHDSLLEFLTVEYRLFTQKNGNAPEQLILPQKLFLEHQASIEDFKREVAPNIEIKVSQLVPEDRMYFLRVPPLMLAPDNPRDLFKKPGWRW